MGVLRSAKVSARHVPSLSPRDQEQGLSIVAAGTRITGGIEIDGVLRIAGRVNGNIHADGQVLVAPGGVVEGDIMTRQAIVGGEMRGQILADELVVLRTGCTVQGDVVTPRLVVEEGATFNGNLRMANLHVIRRHASGENHEEPRLGDLGVLRSAG
jgi:cytoskeletal protein CcmA (bactofilin family)